MRHRLIPGTSRLRATSRYRKPSTTGIATGYSEARIRQRFTASRCVLRLVSSRYGLQRQFLLPVDEDKENDYDEPMATWSGEGHNFGTPASGQRKPTYALAVRFPQSFAGTRLVKKLQSLAIRSLLGFRPEPVGAVKRPIYALEIGRLSLNEAVARPKLGSRSVCPLRTKFRIGLVNQCCPHPPVQD